MGTATRYELQERLNSGGWTTIHNAGGTSKAITGKTAGSWGYRIRACNVAGCAATWSGIKTVQVTPPPAGVPTLSSTVPNGSGVFTLSWNTVTGATSYRLEENATGSWSQIHDGATTSLTLVRPWGNYNYRVRACNTGGCTGYSATRLVVIEQPCPECQPDSVPEQPEEEQ